jgi:hypothetical protein
MNTDSNFEISREDREVREIFFKIPSQPSRRSRDKHLCFICENLWPKTADEKMSRS